MSMKNKEIKDELENISPFLSGLKKEEAFNVPKNYFEQLPDQILDKVRSEDIATENKPSFLTVWLKTIVDELSGLFSPRLAVGLATAAILLISALVFLGEGTTTGEDAFLADLSNEEIELYLSENIEVIDEDFLLEISQQQEGFDLLGPLEIGEEQLEDLIEELDDELLQELL